MSGRNGVLIIMHGRSRMTIGPRITTTPRPSTSGFHRPGRRGGRSHWLRNGTALFLHQIGCQAPLASFLAAKRGTTCSSGGGENNSSYRDCRPMRTLVAERLKQPAAESTASSHRRLPLAPAFGFRRSRRRETGVESRGEPHVLRPPRGRSNSRQPRSDAASPGPYILAESRRSRSCGRRYDW